MALAVFVEGQSLDVLHHEVRQSVFGRVAIEQARDVRVVEARKDLPLIPESAQHRICVHAALDELDRGLVLVLAVRAPREID
jgi:hypothetical protein